MFTWVPCSPRTQLKPLPQISSEKTVTGAIQTKNTKETNIWGPLLIIRTFEI